MRHTMTSEKKHSDNNSISSRDVIQQQKKPDSDWGSLRKFLPFTKNHTQNLKSIAIYKKLFSILPGRLFQKKKGKKENNNGNNGNR